MASLYGSQGDTIAENSFIWASRMNITLSGPNANAAGTVKLGSFTVSSLLTRDVTSAISISDLMKAVTYELDVKKKAEFTLQAGVVNHSVASSMYRVSDVTNYTEDSDLGAEIV